MTHQAVIFLAAGFEELEALAPADVFRRAGIPVTLCGVSPDAQMMVPGSHGVKVQCDIRLADLRAADYDVCYLPGGMPGAATLAATPAVLEAARGILASGGLVAAICAAPLALDAAGLLEGVEYTCYPGVEKQIRHGSYTGKYIQRSGRLLTACGPAAALDFSLEILRALELRALANQLSQAMQQKR